MTKNHDTTRPFRGPVDDRLPSFVVHGVLIDSSATSRGEVRAGEEAGAAVDEHSDTWGFAWMPAIEEFVELAAARSNDESDHTDGDKSNDGDSSTTEPEQQMGSYVSDIDEDARLSPARGAPIESKRRRSDRSAQVDADSMRFRRI